MGKACYAFNNKSAVKRVCFLMLNFTIEAVMSNLYLTTSASDTKVPPINQSNTQTDRHHKNTAANGSSCYHLNEV